MFLLCESVIYTRNSRRLHDPVSNLSQDCHRIPARKLKLNLAWENFLYPGEGREQFISLGRKIAIITKRKVEINPKYLILFSTLIMLRFLVNFATLVVKFSFCYRSSDCTRHRTNFAMTSWRQSSICFGTKVGIVTVEKQTHLISISVARAEFCREEEDVSYFQNSCCFSLHYWRVFSDCDPEKEDEMPEKRKVLLLYRLPNIQSRIDRLNRQCVGGGAEHMGDAT